MMNQLASTRAQSVTLEQEECAFVPSVPQLLPVCKLGTFGNPEFH